MHLARKTRGQDMDAPPKRMSKMGECSNPVCHEADVVKGFCMKCYRNNKLYGNPNGKEKISSRHISSKGYVYMYDPIVKCNVLEHRKIMEENIGRKLFNHETVHHKNGNRSDNRIENLELWSSSQPSGQRVEDKVKWALEIIAVYAAETKGI